MQKPQAIVPGGTETAGVVDETGVDTPILPETGHNPGASNTV